MEVAIRVENLSKTYQNGEAVTEALKPTTLSFERGRFTAIIGHSGSGKSTLLQLMGALDTPTSGKVMYGEQNIFEMSPKSLSAFRRQNIGFVFQSYNLLDEFSALDNILLPFSIDGRKRDEEHVKMLTDFLEISDKVKKFPSQLSGGEQQRVAIARALALEPDVLLADEPTGNLDSRTGVQVIELLREVVTKLGKTLVLVTHDLSIAEAADVRITMENGVAVANSSGN